MQIYRVESEACATAMELLRNCDHEDAMRVLEWRAAGMSWVAIVDDLRQRMAGS